MWVPKFVAPSNRLSPPITQPFFGEFQCSLFVPCIFNSLCSILDLRGFFLYFKRLIWSVQFTVFLDRSCSSFKSNAMYL